MVRNALSFRPEQNELELYANEFVLKTIVHSHYHVDHNIHVLAAGKAVTGMCKVIEDLFGEHIVNGIAVVNEGAVQALEESGKQHLLPGNKFDIIVGGDGSYPCEQSVNAAKIFSDVAGALTSNDILITLISGGGSALLTHPKPPLTLVDKYDVTKLMKSVGVTTLEQNTVRKNLSLIKGGGLCTMASPARVISLILSNLPHNKSTDVASGPTTPDSSTPQQALEIFRKYRIVDKAPPRVIELLRHEAEEATAKKWFSDSLSFKDIYSGPQPRHDTSNTVNILAGSDEIAVGAILSQCAKYEIPACAVIQTAIKPGTRENGYLFALVAQYVASILKRSHRSHHDTALIQNELECIKMGMTKEELKHISKAAEDAASMRRPVCLIFTSEITVEILGSGKGGPCQEVALATAIELKKKSDKNEALKACDVQLFSIDSDGMDGSTNVAGAFANCLQASRTVNGRDAQYYLDNNDSFSFYAGLEGGKYQVVTGATGTDIQNFQLLLISSKDL